eukprot:TRINITY_DN16619_c0_g1_i1.p1 TRINITY_DN16619_c0_g1~~TRINITY_DN16619_c0_g1_i1.p1  ORF type:complete len:102 (-),score=5.87 TRINITY_DN16619_c0_g1_i1:95-400(-)
MGEPEEELKRKPTMRQACSRDVAIDDGVDVLAFADRDHRVAHGALRDFGIKADWAVVRFETSMIKTKYLFALHTFERKEVKLFARLVCTMLPNVTEFHLKQ